MVVLIGFWHGNAFICHSFIFPYLTLFKRENNVDMNSLVVEFRLGFLGVLNLSAMCIFKVFLFLKCKVLTVLNFV